MQEVFEKIKKNLVTELTFCSGYPNCSEYDYAYEVAMYDARNKATAIVNQVAEEYKDSEIYQLAMIYAEKIMKYGLDITKRWETATSQSAALERAYMRGMQEQIDKFNQLKEEYNNGWIPVSERLPNFEERKKAYCRNEHGAEFVVMIEGATLPTTLYIKMQEDIWFDEQGELYNVVAWQPLPEPYQPKGEKE